LVIENKLYNTNDKDQLNALKQGFYEIIPQSINSILDEIDLRVNFFFLIKIFNYFKKKKKLYIFIFFF